MSIYTIADIINHIHTNTNEICGYIDFVDYTENLSDIIHIKTNDGPNTIDEYNNRIRGSCTIDGYYFHIWHTHPKSSKYYPSWEDIIKVIKHEIISSHIYTAHGYWILTCLQNISKRDNFNQTKREFEEFYNDLSSKFYHMTNRGRTFNYNAILDFIQGVNYFMKNYLKLDTFSISWNMYPNE